MKLPLTWKKTKKMNFETTEYVRKKCIEELVDLGLKYKINTAFILVRKEVIDYVSLSFPEESKDRFYSFDLYFETESTKLRLLDFTSPTLERVYQTKKMLHFWTGFFRLDEEKLQKKQFDEFIGTIDRIATEFEKAALPLQVGYPMNVADFIKEAPKQLHY